MPLTAYWRCESDTFDATHDYRVQTMTVGPGSPPGQISSSGAKYGTNGLYAPDFNNCLYRWDTFSGGVNQFVTPAEGAFGCWFRVSNLTGAAPMMFYARSSVSFDDQVSLEIASIGGPLALRLRVKEWQAGQIDLDTDTGLITANAWHWLECRWKSSINYRSVAIRDASFALLDETIDSTTSFATYLPPNLNDSIQLLAANGLTGDGTLSQDNIFLASNYDEPFHNFATISSYTEYGQGGAARIPSRLKQRFFWRGVRR